jgi:DeoR family transcriptional regulator of aga operon
VVVVTESIKFLRKSVARFARAEQVDTVVTDVDISPEDKSNLEDRGVSVVIAE